MGGGRGILDVAGGAEPVQGGQQGSRQQGAGLRRRQRLDLPGQVPGVFGQDAHSLGQRYQVFLQQRPVPDGDNAFIGHDGQRPEHENKTDFLLIVADNHEYGSFGNR